MTFVTTGLLIAGALAMGVPILIHLLSRQRRRPVQWAAMRFLLEALRKHRRRLQLEQLLLLAVRCLVLLLLGAALARPILESAGLLDGGGARTVFLVIDNGLVSGAAARKDEGRSAALSETVELAVGIVAALKPGDRVGVITAARPARGVVVPPSGDHRAIIELLRALEPAQAPTDLPATLPILAAALDELGPERERAMVYMLSEFRAGSAQLEHALPAVLGGDTAPSLFALSPARAALPNVQITAVEPLRGLVLASGEDAAGQVTVALGRGGGELPAEVTRVRLQVEGLAPVEPRVVEWAPGQRQAQVDFIVNLGGRGNAGVALTAVIDDDALPADNARHTVLASRDRIRALLIDRRSFGPDPDLDRLNAGGWIRRALQPSESSPIDVVDVDPVALDPVDLRAVDAAIVSRPDLVADEGWLALRRFVVAGGLLVVVPPGGSNVHQWTEPFARGLDLPWRIALEVDEPDDGLVLADEQPATELLRILSTDLEELCRPVVVHRLLPVDPRQTHARTILRFADGTPLLVAGPPQLGVPGPDGNGDGERPAPIAGAGMVAYLAVSPDLAWTNLPAQPLMVPLFHELLKQGIGLIRTAQRYGVGERPGLGLGTAAAALVGPRGAELLIRGDGRPAQPLSRAGLYTVRDHGGAEIGTVAVNIDPAAGRTDPQEPAAVTEWLAKSGDWQFLDDAEVSAALRSADSGAPLAGLLLLAVLGLLVVETVLARVFSHARPGRRKSPVDEPFTGPERAAAAAIAPHGHS